MAWRQTGIKPLPEPILANCQLAPYEQTVKFESKYKSFHLRKCIWMCRLQNSGHFAQGEIGQSILDENGKIDHMDPLRTKTKYKKHVFITRDILFWSAVLLRSFINTCTCKFAMVSLWISYSSDTNQYPWHQVYPFCVNKSSCTMPVNII